MRIYVYIYIYVYTYKDPKYPELPAPHQHILNTFNCPKHSERISCFLSMGNFSNSPLPHVWPLNRNRIQICFCRWLNRFPETGWRSRRAGAGGGLVDV